MKLKRYISGIGLTRLLLLMSLVAGAWVYDYCHKDKTASVVCEKDDDTERNDDTFFCLYNTVSTVSVKAPVLKTTIRKPFHTSINLRIIQQRHARAYHSLKGESLRRQNPQEIFLVQLSPKHYLANPDDEYPEYY